MLSNEQPTRNRSQMGLVATGVSLYPWVDLAAGVSPKSSGQSVGGDIDAFGHVVSLITGLAWPMTILILVYAYRHTLRRTMVVLEQRIAKGDKFTALGISVEAQSSAPLPLASTSGERQPETASAVESALFLSSGANVLLALGETASEGDQSALVGSGDALGLALVQSALLRVSGVGVTATVVRKVKGIANDLLKRYPHIVSVGGPWGNRLTEAIMDTAPLTFEFRYGGVYDKRHDTLNAVEFTNHGMEGVDWAILTFLANPLHTAGRVAVVAGYSGYGTNAAAAVFARLGDFPQLRERHPLEALIRVRISDGVVGDPEVVTVRVVQPDATAA